MDFILEMHLRDNPGSYKLSRAGEPEAMTQAEIMAAWERRLTGEARDAFLGIHMPSAAVFKRVREMSMATDIIRRVAETRRA